MEDPAVRQSIVHGRWSIACSLKPAACGTPWTMVYGLSTKSRSGRTCRSATRGQASIEFTVALVATAILFMGIVKVWAWMVNSMVLRQIDYDQTRQRAAMHRIFDVSANQWVETAGTVNPTTGKVTYHQPDCLQIFGEQITRQANGACR